MATPRQVVLADASALVAVLDERDRNYHRCAKLLRTHPRQRRADDLRGVHRGDVLARKSPRLAGTAIVMGARRERSPAGPRPSDATTGAAWRNAWPSTAICPWHSSMRNSCRSHRILADHPSSRSTAISQSTAWPTALHPRWSLIEDLARGVVPESLAPAKRPEERSLALTQLRLRSWGRIRTCVAVPLRRFYRVAGWCFLSPLNHAFQFEIRTPVSHGPV